MRISDWRSDVCSSDLDLQVAPARQLSCLPKIGGARRHEKGIHVVEPVLDGPEAGAIAAALADNEGRLDGIALLRIGCAKNRNVVEPAFLRSEGRAVGKGCVRKVRFRVLRYH